MWAEDVSPEQQRVLQIIYEAFRDYGRWPIFQYVETAADHDWGLDADELIRTMPPGLLFPDPSVVALPVTSPTQPLALTVRGLTQCDAREDLDLFLAIVQMLVERERGFRPASPTEPADLRLTSEEVQEARGPIPETLLSRAYYLLVGDRCLPIGGGLDPSGAWNLSVQQPARLRPYRGVESINDFLVHCDQQHMAPELRPEEYRGYLIWREDYSRRPTGMRASRTRVADGDTHQFEVDVGVEPVWAATEGGGRRPAEIAAELAQAWTHGIIDLGVFSIGYEYPLGPGVRSPFVDQPATNEELRRAVLASLRSLHDWEELSHEYGSVDPAGIGLVLGGSEDDVRRLLATMKGEGLIEDSPVAAVGHTATEGWARITATGRAALAAADAAAAEEDEDGALVFTDIVRSTEIAQGLGDAAWADFDREHEGVAARLADRHGGTLLENTGDGFLSYFSEVGQAVQFVDDLRAELQTRGVLIRAGVHWGELQRRGERRTGIAINITQRVMEKSKGEGLLVSEPAAIKLKEAGHAVAKWGDTELQGFPGVTWTLYQPGHSGPTAAAE